MRMAAPRGTRLRSAHATSGVSTYAMMSAKRNGSITSCAHRRTPRTNAPLTARKTTRPRVQPPPVRNTKSRPLVGVVTERPRPERPSAGLLLVVRRRRSGRRDRRGLLHAFELFLQHVAEGRA